MEPSHAFVSLRDDTFYFKKEEIMSFNKILLAGTAVFLMNVNVANAETIVTKSTSGPITTTTTTTKTYYSSDMDANNNGILDTQEFSKFVYPRWDRNGDGFITSDEWQTNAVRWYGPGKTQYYTVEKAWDIDGDGRLDPSEFDTVITTTKLYDVLDMNADKTLTGDEYSKATFHVYDTNNDGNISYEEWVDAQ